MTDSNKIVTQVQKDLEEAGVPAAPTEIKSDVLTQLSDELLDDVAGGVSVITLPTIHLDSGHIDVVVT